MQRFTDHSASHAATPQPNSRRGQKVRWNPHTAYRFSRPGSATFAIYEYVKRQYPEWIEESTLVEVARAAGHTEKTMNYVRNVVIPYAVDARYKRFFMVRQ